MRFKSETKSAAGGSAVRVLALALRIMECRTYSYDQAQREFGLSVRTYRRYLQILKKAGMMFDNSAAGRPQPFGTVRYVGYDVMMADQCKAV